MNEEDNVEIEAVAPVEDIEAQEIVSRLEYNQPSEEYNREIGNRVSTFYNLVSPEMNNDTQKQEYGTNNKIGIDSNNTAEKIRGSESNGNYSTYGDIGDDAGISVGAYQFTEKSGMAQKLAENLGYKSIRSNGFKEELGTEKGKNAQDKLYSTYTRRPKELAEKYGIENEDVIGFMVDTNINGGLSSVVESSIKKGGLTMTNLKESRKERYKRLAKSNPKKYAKYLKGWMKRVDEW